MCRWLACWAGDGSWARLTVGLARSFPCSMGCSCRHRLARTATEYSRSWRTRGALGLATWMRFPASRSLGSKVSGTLSAYVLGTC
jgi:hypothetical protein